MIDEKILLERLEEQKSDWNYDYNVPINDAIKIVNQLAEESNNDFCEWKFEEKTGIVWHCADECTTYNLPHSQNLRIMLSEFECKCPHCGKKIKVFEEEEE